MVYIPSLLLLVTAVAIALAVSNDPKTNRLILRDVRTTLPHTPYEAELLFSHSSRNLRSSPTPRPEGKFAMNAFALRVVKSYDGFLRGCADPWTYLLYVRVVPGVQGSTITRNLGRIVWGSEKCTNSYISKLGGFVNDRVLTAGVFVSAYVVIAIEADNAGTQLVNAKVAEQLNRLRSMFRKMESDHLSPFSARTALDNPHLIDSQLEIPLIEKPSDGFLGLGHDFVGFNALLLVSGSKYSGQPAVCSRAAFPICAARDMNKGILVGGKYDDNLWRVHVKVDVV